MALWPDLSTLNAEIYKTISSLGVMDGLAVLIKKEDTRSYGMNLSRDGFKVVASDSTQAVYHRAGKNSFTAKELSLWFPTFNMSSMMIDLDYTPSIMGKGSVLLAESNINQSTSNGIQDLSMLDDDNVGPYQKRGASASMAATSSAVLRDQRPFGIGRDGSVWINRGLSKNIPEEELQSQISAAISDWRLKRYGVAENKAITKASAEFIAKKAIKDGSDFVDICRWAHHRFGSKGSASVKILVDAMRKQKDGKGNAIYEKNRASIESIIKSPSIISPAASIESQQPSM